MISAGGWITLDIVLAIIFTVMLIKKAPQVKKWLETTTDKEKTRQLARGWLLPLGIAFGIYGILWIGFHGTQVEERARAFFNPPIQIMTENGPINLSMNTTHTLIGE